MRLENRPFLVTVANYSGNKGRRKKKIIINASNGRKAAERVKSGEVISVRKATIQEIANLNREIFGGDPRKWFGTSENWRKI